jgi:hypothetical protein
MSERLDSILYTLNSLHAVSITLTELARELASNPAATLSGTDEAPALLADALATTLDLLPSGSLTDDHARLLGALLRFAQSNSR